MRRYRNCERKLAQTYMNIQSLQKLVGRSKKRVGRGHGSGKVKTSGRGTKGQNARGGMPLGFEGGQSSLFKRYPFLRGKGRNGSFQAKPVTINVVSLNTFPEKSTIDLSALKRHHSIDSDVTLVKVIGNGKLTVALTVLVPVSLGAAKSIKSAGGTTNLDT